MTAGAPSDVPPACREGIRSDGRASLSTPQPPRHVVLVASQQALDAHQPGILARRSREHALRLAEYTVSGAHPSEPLELPDRRLDTDDIACRREIIDGNGSSFLASHVGGDRIASLDGDGKSL